MRFESKLTKLVFKTKEQKKVNMQYVEDLCVLIARIKKHDFVRFKLVHYYTSDFVLHERLDIVALFAEYKIKLPSSMTNDMLTRLQGIDFVENNVHVYFLGGDICPEFDTCVRALVSSINCC